MHVLAGWQGMQAAAEGGRAQGMEQGQCIWGVQVFIIWTAFLHTHAQGDGRA
jgi:hypothetical protein